MHACLRFEIKKLRIWPLDSPVLPVASALILPFLHWGAASTLHIENWTIPFPDKTKKNPRNPVKCLSHELEQGL